MKRILLLLLAVIVVLGLFGAVGYTGYRFGVARGTETIVDGDAPRPGLDEFDPRGMPRHQFGFGRELRRGFGGFPTRGFGVFPFLMVLGGMALLTLMIAFIYWLFTRSGWRLTRTVPVATPPPPTETEIKE
jgi:hypothetical protein